MTSQKSVIVGDIGGTNGRLALATFNQGSPMPVIGEMHTYLSADFAGLSPMIGAFIEEAGLPKGLSAKIAIAGPTCGQTGHLTNLDWHEDASQIKSTLSLSEMGFLNDFGALAYAAGYLTEPHTMSIKGGTPVEGAPISVMGPGTGFGVAQLLKVDGKFHVISTEGGHVSYAPVTKLEEDLCQYLRREDEHVSVETLMSGAGLQRIHRFLVDYAGSGNAELRPAEISAAAIDGSEPSCQRAVQVFLSILGSIAGDMVLAHGGRGGVFFGGGILPKIVALLDKSDLASRFVSKGPMRGYLEDVPVNLIVSPNAALIGAAVA
ncbi:glucokinase [Temperatibacter marinus]|uniref:Glucokinase n=1 Tax=Temperatibacter marinus TaxID=1456591 RepID=A0AA52EE86_9PROT|nr:glucokinase [Temperatibacter marinus]WND03105.1 glucokinase [Temperatibacter marinus]